MWSHCGVHMKEQVPWLPANWVVIYIRLTKMRVLLGNIDLHVCVCLLNVMSGSSGSFDSPCTIQWRIQVLRLRGPTFLEIRIAPPPP